MTKNESEVDWNSTIDSNTSAIELNEVKNTTENHTGNWTNQTKSNMTNSTNETI